MRIFYLNNRQDLLQYLNSISNANSTALCYIVFKKFYKQRAYEMNLEACFDGKLEVVSMIRCKIDESDYRKLKHIITRIRPVPDVNDRNKKAIIYKFNVTNTNQLLSIYDTCYKGLQDVQFSDFFHATDTI